MPVNPRQGSFKQVNKQTLKPVETPLTTPNNNYPTVDKDLAALAHISDTFSTRTAINPGRYNDEYAMLLGYPSGTPLLCTYLHRNLSDTTESTIQSEIDYNENSVHTDLTEIQQFELRLLDPNAFDVTDDDDTYNITFQVVTYPGFIPYVGDIFFVDLGDSHIGEARVDDAKRTSYRQGFYHILQCSIRGYLTKERLDFYQSRVKDSFVFDKKVYFNSDFTLLTHASYQVYDRLKKLRKTIIQWYMNKFYAREALTVLRPDRLYDPYVVYFLNKTIGMSNLGAYVTQLLPTMKDLSDTIWYALLEANYVDIRNLKSTYHTDKCIKSIQQSNINWLLNKNLVALGDGGHYGFTNDSIYTQVWIDEVGKPYVFSSAFYDEYYDGMTLLEKTVYDAKIKNTLDPVTVVNIVTNYQSLDKEVAFYHVPVYVYLIDAAVNALGNISEKVS